MVSVGLFYEFASQVFGRKPFTKNVICIVLPIKTILDFNTITEVTSCLCKLHENLAFMARKFLTLHLIPSANLEALADSCSCDPNSKNCMYGDCEICKMKFPSVLSLCASDVRVTYPVGVRQ